ncbi:hypothetical protein [Streptomyces sp. NPDC047315]|uniref:deazapurine DNA modification protein DpdA family protein n=1 Tax=Streptomyces sp. NPDC047315 TaxID=3155142 RepID=UPI0033E69BC5
MTQPTPLARGAMPPSRELPATDSPGMRFYLTTHKKHWLRETPVDLFLKSEHLAASVKPLRAIGRYAVDSGGFMELKDKGAWTRPPRQYVQDLRRIWEHVGPYDWAAQQDWMCEEAIIHGGTFNGQHFVGTHLSVAEHQRRTVANFLELRSLAPELRIAPVLQGRSIPEYERCVELFENAGVDLRREPVVGLGSVCRLQSTREGAAIVTAMAAHGFRLHGFGFKTLGLSRVGHLLASADSAAWSTHARHRPPLPDHTHKNCANCIDYALMWRNRVINSLPPQDPGTGPEAAA